MQGQKATNFFSDQEIFFGKSSHDLCLLDLTQLNSRIKDMEHWTEEIYKNQKATYEERAKLHQNVTDGSLIDLILQNCPQKYDILDTHSYNFCRFTVVDFDFNMMTQFMRAIRLDSTKALDCLMLHTHRINKNAYNTFLEWDLFDLMNLESTERVMEFFETTHADDQDVQNDFCNFEFRMDYPDIPQNWFEANTKTQFFGFKDDANQH